MPAPYLMMMGRFEDLALFAGVNRHVLMVRHAHVYSFCPLVLVLCASHLRCSFLCTGRIAVLSTPAALQCTHTMGDGVHGRAGAGVGRQPALMMRRACTPPLPPASASVSRL